jgi:uncharacterized protein YecE (DUF72 family)
MLPLFDEPRSSTRESLAPRLAELAKSGIYIGTSSWKYEGWLGQVYTPERYFVRGRFSKKKFETECLSEYAETFPTVCGDFAFYQFPEPEHWVRLFRSAPASLVFALKVPEEITVKVYTTHPRYGPRAGTENPTYLDAAAFDANFVAPLRPFSKQARVLIVEFGRFGRTAYERFDDFLRDLDGFLAKLPEGFRYAVEVRNPEFLRAEYFSCLKARGVAHVFNAWSRMPVLREQVEMPGAFTADFTVVRGLLRFGRPYEKAVERFSPYREVQDPNPEVRESIRDIIARNKLRREEAYIYVNNRLEGNAPGTIEAVIDLL